MGIQNWSGVYAAAQTLLNTDENHITGNVDFNGGVTIQPGQTVYMDGDYYIKFKYPSTIQGSQNSRIYIRPDKSLKNWLSYYWDQFSRSDTGDTNRITIKWLQLSGCQYFSQAMHYATFEDCYIDHCWNIFHRTADGTHELQFDRCTFGRGYWRYRPLNSKDITFNNCLFWQTYLNYNETNTGGVSIFKNFCEFRETVNWDSGVSYPSNFDVVLEDCVVGDTNNSYTGTSAKRTAFMQGMMYAPLRDSENSYLTVRRCIVMSGFSMWYYAHGFKTYSTDYYVKYTSRYYAEAPGTYDGIADDCYCYQFNSSDGYDDTTGSDINNVAWAKMASVTNARSSPYNARTVSSENSNLVGNTITFTCNTGTLANVEIEYGPTTSYGMQTGFPSTYRNGEVERPGTSFKRTGHSIAHDVSSLSAGTYHWRVRGVEAGTGAIFHGSDQTFVISGGAAPGIPTILTLKNENAVGAVTGTDITVTWTDPGDIGTGHINVYLSTTGHDGWTKNGVSPVAAGVQKATISGLLDGQRYYVRLTAESADNLESQPSDSLTVVCTSSTTSYVNELLEAIRVKLATITTGNGYFHTISASNIIVGDLSDLEQDKMLSDPTTNYPYVEILVDAGKGEGAVSQRDIREDERIEVPQIN